MNVLIYGPPGIGKSTLIRALSALQKFPSVIDLEEVPESEWLLPRRNCVMGMAGVHPAHQFRDSVKVLLYMDQRDYNQRRQLRDSSSAEKALQPSHSMSHWLTLSLFDYVVNVSGPLSDSVRKLSAICSLSLVD